MSEALQPAARTRAPRVRAGFERAMLNSFARDPALEEHIMEAVDPELVAYVENARSMTWLDSTRTSAFRRAQVAYHGWQKTREHYTDLMLEFTEGTLMRTVAQALIRIFGVHADKTHRVYPHIWSAFTRDMGRVDGELLHSNACRIYIREAPVEELDYEYVLVMHEAALHAMFRFAKVPVRIEREGSGHAARFTLKW